MLIVKILVLFTFSSLVFAEQNVINLNLHDRNFPSIQGKIHDVVKDNSGFYWLATSDGLKRYDGKEVQVFFGEKHESLHNKMITVVKLQGQTLWVGTDSGLFSVDLASFELNLHSQFTLNTSTPRAGFISNIDIDRFGRIWITSPKGIDLYLPQSQKFRTFPIQNFGVNKRDSYVIASAVDDKGGVWLATYSHGLQYLDVNNKVVVPAGDIATSDNKKVNTALYFGRTTDVIASKNGGILALAKGYVFTIDSSTKEISPIEITNTGSVVSMIEDHYGFLWLVDKEQGLLKLSPDRKSFSSVISNESNLNSHTMVQGVAGEIIFISEQNSLQFVSQIHRDLTTYPLLDSSNPAKTVLSGFTPKGSLAIKDGSTWLYSFSGRLIKFRDKAIVHDHKLELEIFDITSDKKVLWLAASNGLYRYDPSDQSLQQITTIHSRQLKHSSQSGVWVVGVNNIINVRDGRVTEFTTGSSASMMDRHLVTGPNGRILLVTSSELYEFDIHKNKFVSFHNNDFLGNQIYAATLAGNKLVLLGNEVVIHDLSDLNGTLSVIDTTSIPYGVRKAFSLQVIGRDLWISASSGKNVTTINLDNYQTKELNAQYGFPRDEGALLFKVTPESLVFLDPSRLIQLDNYQSYLLDYSEMRITKSAVLSENLPVISHYSVSSSIVVKPNSYALRFSFSDMQGRREEGNDVAEYRLLGRSDVWVKSKDNSAVFVGLMPGSYTFEVRNRYPPYRGQGVNVTVLPAFWQSNLAYGLYALCVLTIVGIIFSLKRDKFVSELIAGNQARIYAKGFENVTQSFCVVNSQGSVKSINLAFAKNFGDVSNLRNLLHSQTDNSLFIEMFTELSSGQDWRGLLYFTALNGTVIPMECTAAEIAQNGGDDVYMLLLSDVSQRLEHERNLENMARYDFLTGLPNRNYFTQTINEKTASMQGVEAKPFFLMFMDVDRFKNINDSLSHEAGDQMLLSLSKTLVNTIGDSGKVFRLGGDEFVVVCDRKANLNPSACADAIARRLARATEFGPNKLFISVSIGISLFPQDGHTVNLLLSKADMAMYSAKNAGGNCYRFFTAKMEAQAADSLRLESDIRRAISDKEFIVYYQAKVAMPTGSLVGYEALVRWQDPHEGLISPLAFIDAAEKTGSIVQIGLLVVEMVCQQMKAWSENGNTMVPVAINVSPQQLKQPNFYNDVVEILDSYAIVPALIEFEITEGVVMDNMSICLGHIRQLKFRGHKIYIDDFGTGYSSLAYLRKLPIDVLKIDKSFVKNLCSDSGQQSIVKSIIDLALNLDLELVAEGVEDNDTADYLIMLGCSVAQGYLYAKPVPATELACVVQNLGTATPLIS